MPSPSLRARAAGLLLALLGTPSALAAGALEFADGFEPEPPPEADYCTALASDPLVQPAGREGSIRRWEQVFFAAPFYTPTTYLHPVGSVSLGELAQPGRWLAVAFTTVADAQYRLDWVEAQTLINSDAGIRYNGRPAFSAFVTVSPCPGDFRLADNDAADGFLKRGCRRSANTDSIRFRTDLATSSTSNCALDAGRTYYLNIGFFEPGETDPMAHTCISGTHCEINIQPQ